MNGWIDREVMEKTGTLKRRGELDTMLATLTADVYREIGAFDAGFEAGVLASEAGLGRYDG